MHSWNFLRSRFVGNCYFCPCAVTKKETISSPHQLLLLLYNIDVRTYIRVHLVVSEYNAILCCRKKILKFFLRFFFFFFFHNKKSLVFARSSFLTSFTRSLSLRLVRKKIFYSRLRCWSLTHYISYESLHYLKTDSYTSANLKKEKF